MRLCGSNTNRIKYKSHCSVNWGIECKTGSAHFERITRIGAFVATGKPHLNAKGASEAPCRDMKTPPHGKVWVIREKGERIRTGCMVVWITKGKLRPCSSQPSLNPLPHDTYDHVTLPPHQLHLHHTTTSQDRHDIKQSTYQRRRFSLSPLVFPMNP